MLIENELEWQVFDHVFDHVFEQVDDVTFQFYQSITSESISFNSHLSDSPARKFPAVVMMRSSCADVPDEIKRRRFPLASERSTLATVFHQKPP